MWSASGAIRIDDIAAERSLILVYRQLLVPSLYGCSFAVPWTILKDLPLRSLCQDKSWLLCFFLFLGEKKYNILIKFADTLPQRQTHKCTRLLSRSHQHSMEGSGDERQSL